MSDVSSNPIDLIDQAIVSLTTVLNDATPGPWWCGEDDQSWGLHGVAFTLPDRPFTAGQPIIRHIIAAPKPQGYWPAPADAQWITTMSPAVGRCLLAWLGAAAERAREHEQILDQTQFTDKFALLGHVHRHPVALARAVLGMAGDLSTTS